MPLTFLSCFHGACQLITSYGGIYETSNPAREYTLDDFVTLNLEKLDRFNHLRGTGLEELEAEWKGSDDEAMGSDSDDEESESEDEGEEGDEMDGVEEEEDDEEAKARRHAALSQAEKVCVVAGAIPLEHHADDQDALRQSATKYMGVAKDDNRPLEDVLSTPLPGENLRSFYDRSREWNISDALSGLIVQANTGLEQLMKRAEVEARLSAEKDSVSPFRGSSCVLREPTLIPRRAGQYQVRSVQTDLGGNRAYPKRGRGGQGGRNGGQARRRRRCGRGQE